MTLGQISTPSLLEDRAGEVSLAQLLRRVAASDQTAFVLLYEALSNEVRQQVRAVLSAGDAVDAVVAATFLHVWWLAPLRQPDDEDVPAWIRGIAADRIAERQRNAVFTPPDVRMPTQQRLPWSVFSGAYDETVAVVLAGLLGRRGPQKAF